jgi:hypothetical protein
MITAAQFIGKTLIGSSAINLITTANRIYHGMRPSSTVLPAINYYKVNDDSSILTNETYSINCRAVDLVVAMGLAKSVKDLFCGVNNLGTYASEEASSINVFSAARISLVKVQSATPENDGEIWNSPVDISIVY